MKRMIITPDGWPCSLADCRPGFFVYQDHLCLRSEYGGNKIEAYNGAGEYFVDWEATVQPVEYVWINED